MIIPVRCFTCGKVERTTRLSSDNYYCCFYTFSLSPVHFLFLLLLLLGDWSHVERLPENDQRELQPG